MNEKLLDLAITAIRKAQAEDETRERWRDAAQAAGKPGLHLGPVAKLHHERDTFSRHLERAAEHDNPHRPPAV